MKIYCPLSAICDIFFRNSSTADGVAEVQTIKCSQCSYQRPNSSLPKGQNLHIFRTHFLQNLQNATHFTTHSLPTHSLPT